MGMLTKVKQTNESKNQNKTELYSVDPFTKKGLEPIQDQ